MSSLKWGPQPRNRGGRNTASGHQPNHFSRKRGSSGQNVASGPLNRVASGSSSAGGGGGIPENNSAVKQALEELKKANAIAHARIEKLEQADKSKSIVFGGENVPNLGEVDRQHWESEVSKMVKKEAGGIDIDITDIDHIVPISGQKFHHIQVFFNNRRHGTSFSKLMGYDFGKNSEKFFLCLGLTGAKQNIYRMAKCLARTGDAVEYMLRPSGTTWIKLKDGKEHDVSAVNPMKFLMTEDAWKLYRNKP